MAPASVPAIEPSGSLPAPSPPATSASTAVRGHFTPQSQRWPKALTSGYAARVKLEGDQEGIDVLHAMHEKDKTYLKFLVGEAKSNTDLKTTFKADDGRRFVLRVDLKSGNLVVEADPS